MEKVVFLDRDGVVNQDSADYVKSWREFRFIPGSIEACADLCRKGFSLILITNQSGVGRGYFSRETLEEMHRRMKSEISAAGGRIHDIFFCPHLPEDECSCRKPQPGMIQAAVTQYKIRLDSAVMVGDSVKDIECGLSAGCADTVLVRTGNGESAIPELEERRITPDHIAQDLNSAAQWIISRFP